MALKIPLPSPNVIVPKQSFETRRPVFPSVAYFMMPPIVDCPHGHNCFGALLKEGAFDFQNTRFLSAKSQVAINQCATIAFLARGSFPLSSGKTGSMQRQIIARILSVSR